MVFARPINPPPSKVTMRPHTARACGRARINVFQPERRADRRTGRRTSATRIIGRGPARQFRQSMAGKRVVGPPVQVMSTRYSPRVGSRNRSVCPPERWPAPEPGNTVLRRRKRPVCRKLRDERDPNGISWPRVNGNRFRMNPGRADERELLRASAFVLVFERQRGKRGLYCLVKLAVPSPCGVCIVANAVVLPVLVRVTIIPLSP